ncbi:hypothetical protein VitviT2T_005117 [Vitis vinifera]|uniref:BZIP domain-containing protein n=1 Tax=Vitis vinifera TaxID=29760 RepID=A0ABY9BS09_VITVI|nr:hypothetical protein VitviT2T_005117 [Vitis vinifera]
MKRKSCSPCDSLGVRKKRSAIDPDLYLSFVLSSLSPHLLGTCVGLTCDDDDPQAKVEPSSLATPHSFSLSESDGKSKHFKKSVSYKKKKEKFLKMVEDLTHQKELLKMEIENVEQFYNPLKTLNSELNALVANPMGPRVILDLNVSSKETLGPKLVAPLDLNLSIALNADTTQLNRVIATQARKKSL